MQQVARKREVIPMQAFVKKEGKSPMYYLTLYLKKLEKAQQIDNT